MTAKKLSINQLIKILPENKEGLKRLGNLKNAPKEPRIAAFGKYNHGKSTLLNALVGKTVFKAADKRETKEIKEYLYDDIIWVDTPGLDADVEGKDDKKAMKGALEISDVLLLVHNVELGELDKSELELYKRLSKQDKNHRRKIVLALTQIDQVNEEQLETVKNKIKKQVPDLVLFPISAVRYQKGVEQNQPVFIEKSGMQALLDYKQSLIADLSEQRKKERKHLKAKIRIELKSKMESEVKAMQTLIHELNELGDAFLSDIKKAQTRIEERAESLNI